MHSSPEEVYKVLKKHHEYEVWRNNSRIASIYIENLERFSNYEFSLINFVSIERLLIKRKNSLINLALAQFSTNTKILISLYNSNNKAYRIACLSNPFFTPYEIFSWNVSGEESKESFYLNSTTKAYADIRKQFFNNGVS